MARKKKATTPGAVAKLLEGAYSGPGAPTVEELTNRVNSIEEGNGLTLESASLERVKNGAELLLKAGFDPAIWAVDRVECNQWEVACKVKKDGVEVIETVPLFQVKCKCKRLVAAPIVDAAEALYKRVENSRKPKKAKKPAAINKRAPCVLEIAIADAHAGKLAIDGRYNMSEFHQLFRRTVDLMLDQAKGRNIAEIVLPLGNDLLNVDTALLTTTRGTQQIQAVSFAEMVDGTQEACLEAVERCAEVADVRVIHVPGNHDWAVSRSICSCIHHVFKSTRHVSVDLTRDHGGGRKYYHRGNVLLGFCHGNNEKHEMLPGLMAQEQPQAWAESPASKEFHVGHRHFRSTQKVVRKDRPIHEHDGVVA